MDTIFHSNVRQIDDHRDQAENVEATDGGSTKPASCRLIAPIGSGSYHDAAIEKARRDATEARCSPYS